MGRVKPGNDRGDGGLVSISTHGYAGRRRLRRKGRIELQPRVGARPVAVVQRPQNEIGGGVEVGRLGDRQIDLEVALRVVGVEAHTRERGDRSRRLVECARFPFFVEPPAGCRLAIERGLVIVEDALHVAVRMREHGDCDEAISVLRRIAGPVNLFEAIHDLAAVIHEQIVKTVSRGRPGRDHQQQKNPCPPQHAVLPQPLLLTILLLRVF